MTKPTVERFAAAAIAAALSLTSPAVAQEVTDPDMEVDSMTLDRGEAVIFGFGEGFDHQLLLIRHRGGEARSEPLAPDEVRAIFESDGATSRLEIENGTGEMLYFDALADRRGSGGYSPVPTVAVPAGERIAAGDWPFGIATLVIGEFSYGPHGDHTH